MFEWSEEQLALRDAIRKFVQAEIAPLQEELEHGDLPPYDVLRSFYRAFGLDDLARDRFARMVAAATGESLPAKSDDVAIDRVTRIAMTLLPVIEISKYSLGAVAALGVSTGLTAGAIVSKGTLAQKQRWALDLLTLDTIGAWAITEPDSGSDAFGQMRATARRDGDGYVLNGSKTFITNGPYADTIIFICKLDDGEPSATAMADRKVLQFVLDADLRGVERSAPLRKMGLHSSPTGQIHVSDVVVGRDRLLGEREPEARSDREAAKGTFATERASIACMALGIIERCLELSVSYARDRVQFGQPIGSFQLIQEKLARMEVARLNVENLVFRYVEQSASGRRPTLAEASAMKLYAARAATEVAMEAVQVFGGNGYMTEFQVEQLARDAKVLQIYGGTDEIQITHIARGLLAP
jgi:alkylation response protein AidB-like acyl-CoA dehydrogenase